MPTNLYKNEKETTQSLCQMYGRVGVIGTLPLTEEEKSSKLLEIMYEMRKSRVLKTQSYAGTVGSVQETQRTTQDLSMPKVPRISLNQCSVVWYTIGI